MCQNVLAKFFFAMMRNLEASSGKREKRSKCFFLGLHYFIIKNHASVLFSFIHGSDGKLIFNEFLELPDQQSVVEQEYVSGKHHSSLSSTIRGSGKCKPLESPFKSEDYYGSLSIEMETESLCSSKVVE